jgi:hypothetical protein
MVLLDHPVHSHGETAKRLVAASHADGCLLKCVDEQDWVPEETIPKTEDEASAVEVGLQREPAADYSSETNVPHQLSHTGEERQPDAGAPVGGLYYA